MVSCFILLKYSRGCRHSRLAKGPKGRPSTTPRPTPQPAGGCGAQSNRPTCGGLGSRCLAAMSYCRRKRFCPRHVHVDLAPAASPAPHHTFPPALIVTVAAHKTSSFGQMGEIATWIMGDIIQVEEASTRAKCMLVIVLAIQTNYCSLVDHGTCKTVPPLGAGLARVPRATDHGPVLCFIPGR